MTTQQQPEVREKIWKIVAENYPTLEGVDDGTDRVLALIVDQRQAARTEFAEKINKGLDTVQGHSITKDADKCIQMARNLVKNTLATLNQSR